MVRGQAEVLARNPNPSREEVTRVYELVSQATARMELMVDDLLLLARAESSEGLRLEPLELEPLISAEVEGMAFENNRDLVAGVVTGRRVNIDREQVARLLSNLISNAIAHTEEGAGSRCRPPTMDRRWFWPWTTTDPACPKVTGSGSSTVLRGWMSRAAVRWAVPGSVWPSSGRSPRPMEVKRGVLTRHWGCPLRDRVSSRLSRGLRPSAGSLPPCASPLISP